MSVYAIHKICHRVTHDREFRELLRRRPEEALEGAPLDREERAALLAGDIVRLYQMGVHPYLLWHLSRFELLGLTPDVHVARMRTLLTAADPGVGAC